MLRPNFRDIKKYYEENIDKRPHYPDEQNKFDFDLLEIPFLAVCSVALAPIIAPLLIVYLSRDAILHLKWRIETDNTDWKQDKKLIRAMLRIYRNGKISKKDELILNGHLDDVLIQRMVALVYNRNGECFCSVIQSGKISGKNTFEKAFEHTVCANAKPLLPWACEYCKKIRRCREYIR